MIRYDVAVIGGAAAGLMCAIEAGKRGRRVLLIEHCDRVGKKILISGGGRCNFTNLNVTPENFLSANPHFCKSALARYTQWDFISMVERHGIAHHEKELGQLFCDQSARSIVKLLTDECAQAGVRITTDCSVNGVERGANGFFLTKLSLDGSDLSASWASAGAVAPNGAINVIADILAGKPLDDGIDCAGDKSTNTSPQRAADDLRRRDDLIAA